MAIARVAIGAVAIERVGGIGASDATTIEGVGAAAATVGNDANTVGGTPTEDSVAEDFPSAEAPATAASEAAAEAGVAAVGAPTVGTAANDKSFRVRGVTDDVSSGIQRAPAFSGAGETSRFSTSNAENVKAPMVSPASPS